MIKKGIKIFFLVLLLLLNFSIFAEATDIYSFTTPSQARQFHHLCKQFRCLVCQNESLADSNAPLAKDLRFQIYKMVQKNKSNEEIINFLVDRYGDFVLFRPPLTITTFLLWFGPLIMLIAALTRLFWLIHSRKKNAKRKSIDQRFSKDDRKKIRHLLREH